MRNQLLIGRVAAGELHGETSSLEQAVLLTVHYRDLFCHALTIDELKKYLLFVVADDDSLEAAVDHLRGRHLSRIGEYVTWKGREWLVQERRKRLAASEHLWPQ